MEEPVNAAELVERCRRGDAAAAEELFTRYARQLTHVAEEHLSRRVSARVSGEDVVQSVFRTFFRRCADGQFRFDGDNQLWRLLVRITVLKARARGRHHRAAVRDVAAEAPGEGNAWLAETAAEVPGPLDAAVLVDLIESLLQGLPPLYGQLLEMRLQGYRRSEIADALGVSRHTVYRALEAMQRRLDALVAEEK